MVDSVYNIIIILVILIVIFSLNKRSDFNLYRIHPLMWLLCALILGFSLYYGHRGGIAGVLFLIAFLAMEE